jgi:hypothetical protein
MFATAANSSPITGTEPGAILFESPQRPRAGVLGSFGASVLPLETYSCADLRPLRHVRFQQQPSCTGSTLLAGPVGALGFMGELAADLLGA